MLFLCVWMKRCIVFAVVLFLDSFMEQMTLSMFHSQISDEYSTLCHSAVRFINICDCGALWQIACTVLLGGQRWRTSKIPCPLHWPISQKKPSNWNTMAGEDGTSQNTRPGGSVGQMLLPEFGGGSGSDPASSTNTTPVSTLNFMTTKTSASRSLVGSFTSGLESRPGAQIFKQFPKPVVKASYQF